MVDRLRDERVRLAEQHQFLSQVLRGRRRPASSSSASTSEVTSLNPAAERLLDRAAADADRPARSPRWSRRSRPRSTALAPGESRVVGLRRRAARRSASHGTFVDRGFPRSFLLIEELTERAAAGRAGGLREADSRDVARGQQHRRLVELAAPVVAHLRRRARRREPARLRDTPSASSSRGPSSSTRSCGLRRRLPAAGAGAAAVRARGDPRARRARCSARGRTPPASRGGGSSMRRRSACTPIRRSSSRRSSTSSRTPSRRSTARRRSRSA